MSTSDTELIVEAPAKYRRLTGPARLLQRALLIGLIVTGVPFILGIHIRLGLIFFTEQMIGLFLSLTLGAVFLTIRPTKTSPVDRVPWYDWLLLLGGFLVGGYLLVRYPSLVFRIGYFTPFRTFIGALTVFLILEACRRMIGWVIVIVVSFFVLYARFTYLAPEAFSGESTPWDQLMSYLFLESTGMPGMVAIAATIAVGFIFFAQVLMVYGGASFFNDIALAAMGRFRGGPAKAAVVGSSIIGTMTGGPVTNVMITGSVTIPLMKRTGYKPQMAAAIEAAASTGGQIMPPIMGIAAFIIAEFLEIPYATVALAALIPALLYYLALFVQVDLEAGKSGLRGLPPEELPSARAALKRGWIFVLPLLFLIYTLLIERMHPGTAGVWSALFALALTPALKENRKQFWSKLIRVLEDSGKILLDITAILAAAGFIIAIMSISGLGFIISLGMIHIAGSNVFLLLILSAIVCLILGMGMPSVAAYVLVAILVAPGLEQMGILALAAHLFVFYFAIISNITPPVALASYAGAALAGSNPMRTGLISTRLGILAYIMPFLFVFAPVFLMKGSALQIILYLAAAVTGAWLLGIMLMGYLFKPVGWWRRIAFAVAALGLFASLTIETGNFAWIIRIAVAAIALPILFLERHGERPMPVRNRDS